MIKHQVNSIVGNLKAMVVILSGQGKWNKADKSMTWNYIDFSNYGINGKIIENFNSDGMIRTRTVMKDKGRKIIT